MSFVPAGKDTNINILPTSVSGQTVKIVDSEGHSIRCAEISGQPDVHLLAVSISGQNVSISGQPVTTTVSVNISGQVVNLPTSTEIIARISGQTVVASVTTNVSGQVVRVSGETLLLPATQEIVARVSGQEIVLPPATLSGLTVLSRISGQVVRMSGETVSLPASTSVHISGETILISGQTVLVPLTSISGNVVQALTSISGNVVNISGQTVNASVQTNISGQVVQISGQTVVASVTTNISGQTVYLASGFNTVVASVQTNVSGNVVQVSGQTVSLPNTQEVVSRVSGAAVRVSGEAIRISGEMVLTDISGKPVKISGETVVLPFTSISGNVVNISGQTVNASVTTNISGQVVYLTSGQNQIMSRAAPTYHIWTDGQILTSGATLLAGHYVSGVPTIRIKKIFLQNLNTQVLVSGMAAKFDVIRSMAAPTGGTALVAITSDPTDPQSGVAVTWQTKNTNDMFTSGRKFFSWVTNNQTTVPSSGTNAQLPMSQLAARFEAGTNLLAESTEIKEIRMTSGYGFAVKQSTSGSNLTYTQAVSGIFGVYAVYTVE